MRRLVTGIAATAAAFGGIAGVAAAAPLVTPAAQQPGRMALYLQGTFPIRSGLVTVPRRPVRVGGVVRPFVAGEVAVVKAYEGARLIHAERVRVARSPGGTYGHFSVRFTAPAAGRIAVVAVHRASRALARIEARARFAALAPVAGPGSRGPFVELVQSRLAALHLFLPQTGVFDEHTGLAIGAYRRLLGRGTSQSLDSGLVAAMLVGVGQFHLRDPRAGRHAEGDLHRQLLALAAGGKVFRIFPISSGKPSTPTILGHYRVYSKVPYYLPDGMYFSDFFDGGYAIHGYDPAPDYPASHGCMRVPISDAVAIYNWLRIGDVVDTYL